MTRPRTGPECDGAAQYHVYRRNHLFNTNHRNFLLTVSVQTCLMSQAAHLYNVYIYAELKTATYVTMLRFGL